MAACGLQCCVFIYNFHNEKRRKEAVLHSPLIDFDLRLGLFPVEALHKNFALLFVSGFAQQGKHVFLISFNARLVEGIHAEYIPRNAARELEEVDKPSEVFPIDRIEIHYYVWDSAVHMGKERTAEGLFVYEVEVLPCKEVETVDVLLVRFDNDVARSIFYVDHSLKQVAHALLDVLAHRVEVGSEVD